MLASFFSKLPLLLLLLVFVVKISVASGEPIGLVEFSEAVSDIEKLVDSKPTLAYQKLQAYKNHIETASVKQQILYYNVLAEIYIAQEKYQIAEETANLGLAQTKNLTSPSLLMSKLLYSRGFAYESMGNFQLASQDYESGLAIAKSFNDAILTARGLINLGAVYYLTDRYEKSLTVLNNAYYIAQKTNDEELQGSVNSELGILYDYLDRSKQSMDYYLQAYQHYKKAKKARLSLNALVNIATSHIKNEEYEQAIKVYQSILEESEHFSQHEIMYSAYSGLSWVNLKKQPKDPQASYHYLLKAKELINDIELRDTLLFYTADEAVVFFELDRLDDSLLSINKVEQMLSKQTLQGRDKKKIQTNMLAYKAKIYFKQEKFKQAYQLQEQRFALVQSSLDQDHARSIAEVRLALEAKQADLNKETLENLQSLQRLAIAEAEKKQQQLRAYLISIAIVVLLLAWFLYQLVKGQHHLDKISNIDMLTGIANRRSLLKHGKQLFSQAVAKQADFSVLMIDADHFKMINDQFSHSVGDKVLKAIAKLGLQLMRKTDVFGRFGGEEFIILLPNTTHAQALVIAERFRQTVENFCWTEELLVNRKLTVTVSIGVACTTTLAAQDKKDLAAVIHIADTFLYEAKSLGRNQVCG